MNCHRNYSPTNKRLKWKPVLSLEEGKIYTGVRIFSHAVTTQTVSKGCYSFSQGSLEELQRLTGWGDERVLYFGDHPYADLADLVIQAFLKN